ncbi:hypothetical protein PHMEG_00035816 [Phytophthora megakarya]|uniref:Uncharacterized protein n=1 Tax=Phytophthora megakarya TaxID=4795 RepID=A0A225UQL7_9STRA|nr:hypothetical protein PHMEG_00035816 [Phytophthora megakarya]
MAMGRRTIDLLTIQPHDQIEPQGIDHVSNRLKAALEERNLTYSQDKNCPDFHLMEVCFKPTWLDRFPPTLRNVRGVNRQIVNRTNNPLEWYNRELNNEVATRRPNVQTFVSVIEQHAHRYVTLLQDVARGRVRPPIHGVYYTPP